MDSTYKVGERIDSFSFTEFKNSLESHLGQGPATLTLDLLGTNFLSIPCIKLIAFCADQLLEKGGRVILLGPTEKLKRQIGIYGSLKNVTIKKSEKAPEEQPSVGLPVHDEIPGF
jgi:anti-anti-sigma regulatory factor